MLRMQVRGQGARGSSLGAPLPLKPQGESPRRIEVVGVSAESMPPLRNTPTGTSASSAPDHDPQQRIELRQTLLGLRRVISGEGCQ